jgi:hypothetical protein
VEPAIERRTADLPAQPLLQCCHFLHHNFPIVGTTRQDRRVAHKTRTILNNQNAVPELDRLRHLAADDQLGLRLVAVHRCGFTPVECV